MLFDARSAYDWRGRLEGGDIQKTRQQVADVAKHLSKALHLLEDDFVEMEIRAQELGPEPADSEIEAAIDRHDGRVRAVEELRDLCREAGQRKGTGRPSKEDLRRFVAVLAIYWQDELGRKFTEDFHSERGKLEPATSAAAFVTEAARVCGVNAKPGEIRYAMRTYENSIPINVQWFP